MAGRFKGPLTEVKAAGFMRRAAGTRILKRSEAITAGRARRSKGAVRRFMKVKWFINKVSDKIAMTMKARTMLATKYVMSKVVYNISRPVTKSKGPRGGKVVTDRSKAGEFPKVETATLMRGIFSEVRQTMKGNWDGYVGTPHDYGLILETRMNRSFLVRTLNEERGMVRRILTGPIK